MQNMWMCYFSCKQKNKSWCLVCLLEQRKQMEKIISRLICNLKNHYCSRNSIQKLFKRYLETQPTTNQKLKTALFAVMQAKWIVVKAPWSWSARYGACRRAGFAEEPGWRSVGWCLWLPLLWPQQSSSHERACEGSAGWCPDGKSTSWYLGRW